MHFDIKNCVRFFSEAIEARIFKLSIHMENSLLYCRMRITHCPYSSIFLSIFVFGGYICVTVFSGTVQARIFKHGSHVYIE